MAFIPGFLSLLAESLPSKRNGFLKFRRPQSGASLFVCAAGDESAPYLHNMTCTAIRAIDVVES